ncbi:apoptosis-resistant E3 ubiquitin protein ligase 1 [Lampetra fluviatilis]
MRLHWRLRGLLAPPPLLSALLSLPLVPLRESGERRRRERPPGTPARRRDSGRTASRWQRALEWVRRAMGETWETGMGVSVVLATVVTAIVAWELFLRLSSFLRRRDEVDLAPQARSLYDYVRGNYVEPRSCRLLCDWDDPHPVGHTMTFSLQLFYKNGQPCPLHQVAMPIMSVRHCDLGMNVPLAQDVSAASFFSAAHEADTASEEVEREGEGEEEGEETAAAAPAAAAECESQEVTLGNTLRAAFTVRRAGRYQISVTVAGRHVDGSPALRSFSPGPVVPSKTRVLHHLSTLVLRQGELHTLTVTPHDEFGNRTAVGLQEEDAYSLSLTALGAVENEVYPGGVCYSYELHAAPALCQLSLRVEVQHVGCFRARITHRGGQPLANGDFDIIVLTDEEVAQVDKNVQRTGLSVYHEAFLQQAPSYAHVHWALPDCGPPTGPPESPPAMPGPSASAAAAAATWPPALPTSPTVLADKMRKAKKVYCYISPKQLTIKEYYLRIIPWRLLTFRVCPGTKFHYYGRDAATGLPTLVIDDGTQPPAELVLRDRNVLAATFTRFLLRSIGGSETCQDKMVFFQRELRKLHAKKPRNKISLRVSRQCLLDSSVKAVRNFSSNDWFRSFEVTFENEEALDRGGPRREWFELMCKALFEPANKLFTHFVDDNQALVHPNPHRPHHMRLRLYELAGRLVGKCLFETSLGDTYRQLVRARFTRSFLAQLIGLRMHYRYFETDDPEFYKTKVSFVLNNDVSEMDLTLSEEVYDEQGKCVQVVDLVPGGSGISVTNANKLAYLNVLAQYRLATQVRTEVEHFLKGLNEMVPENLLAIFDENELEMLMCGTEDISVDDFKANAVLVGASWHFRKKVILWFWAVVSSFTQEELARLLQFSTGSSLLPTGGFAALSPPFQIVSSPKHGTLPTAHTCFNQLCLPTYDSCEELHKMLRYAITEGSEGFGLL